MRVDAARLAAWRSEVALAAADAELHAAAELESWAAAHPGRTVEEAREAAIATASRVSSAYGRVSAATSGRLFDELAEAQGHGARFEVVDTTGAAYTEEAVRKLANRLRDGDEDGFRRGVSQLVGNQVRRNSQASMAANCDRAGVRWARVPSGPKPCPFCFMVASRGFVYKSKASAGGFTQWHKGCMCAVVPDFDGKTEVQGYDPDGMYRRWRMCADTVGSDPEATSGEATRAILRECATRDTEWLATGKVPEPTYESRRAERELREHERKTRDVLSANGFIQHILERSNEPRVKTADLLLSGRRADYKTPRGAGFNSIDQLMRDAGKKADVAVIHLQEGLSQMSAADAEKHFIVCGERRGIREAVIIDYDEAVKRVKI